MVGEKGLISAATYHNRTILQQILNSDQRNKTAALKRVWRKRKHKAEYMDQLKNLITTVASLRIIRSHHTSLSHKLQRKGKPNDGVWFTTLVFIAAPIAGTRKMDTSNWKNTPLTFPHYKLGHTWYSASQNQDQPLWEEILEVTTGIFW